MHKQSYNPIGFDVASKSEFTDSDIPLFNVTLLYKFTSYFPIPPKDQFVWSVYFISIVSLRFLALGPQFGGDQFRKSLVNKEMNAFTFCCSSTIERFSQVRWEVDYCTYWHCLLCIVPSFCS